MTLFFGFSLLSLGIVIGVRLAWSHVRLARTQLRVAEEARDFWFERAARIPDPLQRRGVKSFLGEPVEKWSSVDALIGGRGE